MARSERSDKNQQPEESGQRIFHIFGVDISQTVLLRALSLVVIIAVMILAVYLCISYFGNLFTAEGRATLIKDVRQAGPLGALVLLALEFVQVIVAFIPGEVVQVVAGVMYGPWLGTGIIVLGCFLSMWAVYELVHRLGQPFVESLVPTKYLGNFRRFEQSGKLTVVVFILFLIPGLPKDIFTYLVPLTSMPRNEYLAVAMVARLPGIFMSTHAASGLLHGDIAQSVVIFAILGVLGVLGIVFKDRIMDFLHRREEGK